MRSTPVMTYYHFGMLCRYLLEVRDGRPITEKEENRTKGKILYLEALDQFLDGLKDIGLQVTERAASNLRDIREELRAKPVGARFGKDEATRLTRCMLDLETTLRAELEGFSAYVITPKRLDVKKLVGAAAELFSPGTWLALPDLACFDIAEAGMCTAFERSTAAAFHLLRAVEGVLRAFYDKLVRREHCKGREMGTLLNDLRGKHARAGNPHRSLLNTIDHLRENFRNPTQHPEMKYTVDEVQNLWFVCIDVIDRMAAVLRGP